MIIKKLSCDSVKVLIESEDIDKYNVPYHKLSIHDEDSVEFIYRLLFSIYDQTGVSLTEGALNVEAIPACAGNYFITVSRKKDTDEGIFLLKQDDRQGDIFIFSPDLLEDVEGMALLFASHPDMKPSEAALYCLEEKYYILLRFPLHVSESEDFGIFLLKLSEYATRCPYSFENEGVLHERGRLVCGSLFEKINFCE